MAVIAASFPLGTGPEERYYTLSCEITSRKHTILRDYFEPATEMDLLRGAAGRRLGRRLRLAFRRASESRPEKTFRPAVGGYCGTPYM